MQDTTDLDYTHRQAVSGLGKIGDGRGRGFRQQSGLAISETGERLSLMDQQWFLMGVIAIRLLHLRDLIETEAPEATNPKALQQRVLPILD